MTTPNYWCTWHTQNTLSKQQCAESSTPVTFAGDQGAKLARAMLNEKTLFGENGMVNQFEDCRKELYFMLDDGWDVPYGIHPDVNRHLFSSLILDEERFPSFVGSPAQRLRALNQKLKGYGWRGLGIWVACQSWGEHTEDPCASNEEMEAFWTERLEWCRYAEIEYIKVDWGARCSDIAYRHRMSELVRQVSPNTYMEHALPCRPLNDTFGKGSYMSWNDIPQKFSAVADFSDVFRIYDSCLQLGIPTTIDRCVGVLSDLSPQSTCQINCEDELYIAAGLGLSVGAMRSEMVSGWNQRADPRDTNHRTLELSRTLSWFRLAAPFANSDAREPMIHTSSSILSDGWQFEDGDFWWNELYGKAIQQSAPTVCSRNMPLPKILDAPPQLPYILACRYPNGATALSFLPRTNSNDGAYLPMVSVHIELIDAAAPLGLFGTFERLEVLCNAVTPQSRIVLRDLAQQTELDITAQVLLTTGQFTLQHEVIKKNSRFKDGDPSDTGVVIYIRK